MSVAGAPDLVCLGNFTIDDVVLPDGRERLGCTGGDALYAALAARLFTPACELVAPIGNDLPSAVMDKIARAGLSRDGMPARALPTLHNRVVYSANGEREWTLYASEADFDVLSPLPTDIPLGFQNAPAYLILAMTLPAQQRLVAALAETDAVIALDPQEDYIAGAEQEILAMLAGVDIFMPSQEEVRRLTGTTDWERAARLFAEEGPKLVVVKLGADGCLIHDAARETIAHVPAHPVPQVVDTTGAGDSFCGAFMARYLADPDDPVAAARAGAVAASFTVAGYGIDALLEVAPHEARERLRSWT